MIGNNKVSAVLVSTNLEKSQDFYEYKVGLKLSPKTIKNQLLFDCGDGPTMLVYGRGKGNSADHTQVRFGTTDIHKDVAELVGRGVVFEEYDMGALWVHSTRSTKTVDHVVTTAGIGKSAWFKDPDGNTIAVSQPE
jgi:catechol 2,3-dioxygenase-like lactoylglutathione lyase family enzyme